MEAIKIKNVDKSVSCHSPFAQAASRVALGCIDSQSIASENTSVVFKKPFQIYGPSPASKRTTRDSPILVGSLNGLKKFKIVPQKFLKINNKISNKSEKFSSTVTPRVPLINVSRVEDMNATFNEVTGNVKLVHSKSNSSSLPSKSRGDVFNIHQDSNLGPLTMTIVNQYNGMNQSSRTVATLNSGMETGDSESFTSDNLVNLIGQENYNVLFAALCTISSTDLKQKAIRTLLTKQTINKTYSEISVQTPNWDRQYILTHDVSCQTISKVLKDRSVNTDSTQHFQMNSSFTSRQFKKRRRCPTRRQSPYVIDTRNLVRRIDHKEMVTEQDEKLEYQQNVVIHRRKILLPPPSRTFSEESDHNSLKSLQGNDDKIAEYTNEGVKEDNAKSFKVTTTPELQKHCLNKTTKMTENNSNLSFNIFENDNGTEIGSPSMNGGTSVYSLEISESILNDPIGPLEICLQSVTKPLQFEMNNSACNERDASPNPPVPESRREPFNYGKPNLSTEILELTNGVKPEDKFHLVTKESAKSLSPERLKQLINLQMILDWEHCMDYDEFGFLPIHNAAQNNDIPWLQRQCLVLKSKRENVDVGDEQSDMSALQLAVTERSNISCIKVLLKHGANMLYKDVTSSTVLHYCIASEDEEYTNYFIIYMEQNAETILKAADLKVYEDKEVNKQNVLRLANSNYDENGLTPLMLAAKLGRPHSINSLLEMVTDPSLLVNARCVKSGDTALMLAVKSACAADPNNRSTVPEQYLSTIEKLFSYGADPEVDNYAGLNVASLISDNQIPCLVNAVSGTKNSKTLPKKSLYVDNIIHVRNVIPSKQIINKTISIENMEKYTNENKTTEDHYSGTRSEITSKTHNKPVIINPNDNTGNPSNSSQKVASDNLNAVSVIQIVDKPIPKPQLNNVVQVVMNDGKTIWHKIQRPVENNITQRVENANPGIKIISNLNVNKSIVFETTPKSSTVTSQKINCKPKPQNLSKVARLVPKMVSNTNFSANTIPNKLIINPTEIEIISRPALNAVGGTRHFTPPVHSTGLSAQNSVAKLNGKIKVGEFVVKANSGTISNARTFDNNELKSTVHGKSYDNTNLTRKLQIDPERVVLANVMEHAKNANSIATPIRLVNTGNVGTDNGSRGSMDYSKSSRTHLQNKLKLMKSLPIIATGLHNGIRQNQMKNVSDTLEHSKGLSHVQPSKTVVATNQIAASTGLSTEVVINSVVGSSKNENVVHNNPVYIGVASYNVNPPDNYGKLKQLGKLLDEKSKIKATALKSKRSSDSTGQNSSNSTVEAVNKTELSTRVLGKRPKKIPKRYTPDNLSSPSRPKYKRNSSSSDS